MNSKGQAQSPRVLFIDDNRSIHEDFRKVLGIDLTPGDKLAAMEEALFGESQQQCNRRRFRMDSAYQGRDGLALVQKAMEEGDPYALAFVDVRMPPGWDGIETLEHIWAVCPDIQAVICSANSDYTWDDMIQRLGDRDGLLILRKPFEAVEVLQIAHALIRKWELNHAARMKMQDLDQIVQQRTNELVRVNTSLRKQFEEKNRIELALRSSEERFSKAFQASPIPMVIQDVDNRKILDANPAFLDLSNFAAEELAGPDAPAAVCLNDCIGTSEIDPSQNERLRNRSGTLRVKNGSDRKILLSTEPLTVGTTPCLLMTLQDVTEQEALEERLRQARKMEAVGLLAAGIAHEFNNLLTVIQCNASLLTVTDPRIDSGNAQLNQIMEAGNRAASLTSQLLAFSRKRVLQKRPLNLAKVVHQMREMLTKMVGAQRRLDVLCSCDIPPISADEDSIIQVITNLVVNARDATPDGGVIRIETDSLAITEEEAEQHSDARSGAFITLTVTDTGRGMDDETLRHLFEPFFTTKEVGKGTGLGLSTIHGIVQQHEGWVEVSSESGNGSCFRLFLPVTQQAITEIPETHTANILPSQHGNGRHVLIVEDEPTVRELAVHVLRMNGYLVSEAQDGPEAIHAFQSSSIPVDLLVSDMVMPGRMTGAMLARKLVSDCRTLKIILTSGYSPDIIRQDSPLIPGASFLPKPYNPPDLLTAVGTALTAP